MNKSNSSTSGSGHSIRLFEKEKSPNNSGFNKTDVSFPCKRCLVEGRPCVGCISALPSSKSPHVSGWPQELQPSYPYSRKEDRVSWMGCLLPFEGNSHQIPHNAHLLTMGQNLITWSHLSIIETWKYRKGISLSNNFVGNQCPVAWERKENGCWKESLTISATISNLIFFSS